VSLKKFKTKNDYVLESYELADLLDYTYYYSYWYDDYDWYDYYDPFKFSEEWDSHSIYRDYIFKRNSISKYEVVCIGSAIDMETIYGKKERRNIRINKVLGLYKDVKIPTFKDIW